MVALASELLLTDLLLKVSMLLLQFIYSCFRPCCSWRPLYIDCVFAVAGVLVFGGVFAHSAPANGDALTEYSTIAPNMILRSK